ncbi:MAG: dihydrolipoyl dehydrogenase [Actinomycetota bacterium]|nr:dihydrolipoyl dehydrogenase [Actinomycetota bacterium]
MVVGELATSTDVLVIGGGPGGYAAALRVAERGRSVTLVERDAVGGVCLNVGCIPSKTLIHVAETAALAHEAGSWGVDVSAEVDLARVGEHMDAVVGRLTGGVRQLLDGAGVTVVEGTARFSRADRAAVVHGEGVTHVEFSQAIVATGSRPVELAMLPFDGTRVIDSTAALRLDRVPERLVVVGGGYIGLELGTAWAKLGAQVTIVEAADRLLPGMAASLGRVVARRLRQLGVTVLTGTAAAGLDGPDLVVREVAGDDGDDDRTEHRLAAEVVLMAVGRRPNTDDLGLARVGVEVDGAGYIPVGPDRRAAPTILAIGDVTAGPALAHKATAEAEVAAATACGEPAAFSPAAVPQVVFCDPEVVSVGVRPDGDRDGEDAAGATAELTTFRFPFAANGRALSLGRDLGHAEIVADAEGTVLGIHLVGPGVAELAGEAALAVEMAATLEDVAGTIHAHPTLAEAIAEAAHGALGHPLHVRAPRHRD